MAQLFEEDHKVVEMWWQRSKIIIYHKGFTLDNYHPPAKWPREKGRNFRDILKTMGTLSVKAKTNYDKIPVEVTVFSPRQPAPNNAMARGVKYFQVDNNGIYTVVATPINTPPRKRGWLKQLWGRVSP